MTDPNQEPDDGNNGLNIGNEMLAALLNLSAMVSQETENSDNLDSIEAIGGEFSSLNNTIDELNKFMDRWEERHDRLRDEIKDVLSDQTLDEDEETGVHVQGTETDTSGSSDLEQNLQTGEAANGIDSCKELPSNDQLSPKANDSEQGNESETVTETIVTGEASLDSQKQDKPSL